MQDYDVKVQVLYLIQGGRCAMSGRPLVRGQKWDLGHAGITDTKRKKIRAKYLEVTDSILNLQLVEHEAHCNGVHKRWPPWVAEKLERRLRADRALADLMNCRDLSPDFDARETAEIRQQLVEDVGATDTSYRDRIITLALSKRGAA